MFAVGAGHHHLAQGSPPAFRLAPAQGVAPAGPTSPGGLRLRVERADLDLFKRRRVGARFLEADHELGPGVTWRRCRSRS